MAMSIDYPIKSTSIHSPSMYVFMNACVLMYVSNCVCVPLMCMINLIGEEEEEEEYSTDEEEESQARQPTRGVVRVKTHC